MFERNQIIVLLKVLSLFRNNSFSVGLKVGVRKWLV